MTASCDVSTIRPATPHSNHYNNAFSLFCRSFKEQLKITFLVITNSIRHQFYYNSWWNILILSKIPDSMIRFSYLIVKVLLYYRLNLIKNLLLDQSFHGFQEVSEANVLSCFRLACLSFLNVWKKLFVYGRLSWIHVIVSEIDFTRLHVLGGNQINIKIALTLQFHLNELKYLQQHRSRLFDSLKYLQFLFFDAVISFST